MTHRMIVALIAVALLVGPNTAAAQGPEKKAMSPEDRKVAAVHQMRERIQKVATELQLLQRQVMAKRPDLKKKQKKLFKLEAAEMKKRGIDPDEEMAEVMAIQGMLSNPEPGMPAAKKRELQDKLRKKGIALQRTHEAMARTPKIKKAREKFRKEMEAALLKADPNAKKLLKEFYRLRKEMKQLFPKPPQ